MGFDFKLASIILYALMIGCDWSDIYFEYSLKQEVILSLDCFFDEGLWLKRNFLQDQEFVSVSLS